VNRCISGSLYVAPFVCGLIFWPHVWLHISCVFGCFGFVLDPYIDFNAYADPYEERNDANIVVMVVSTPHGFISSHHEKVCSCVAVELPGLSAS
jgi:hypothetical protein